MDLSNNEREACSKLLLQCSKEFGFRNNDFGFAFDFLVWNVKEISIDVPLYGRYLPLFIARAIYDGACSYKYLIDAELSTQEEK